MQPNTIKGLEVAKDFFHHWGKPLLEREFPDLTGRIAAGRFSGSDVLGADDAIIIGGRSFRSTCRKRISASLGHN